MFSINLLVFNEEWLESALKLLVLLIHLYWIFRRFVQMWMDGVKKSLSFSFWLGQTGVMQSSLSESTLKLRSWFTFNLQKINKECRLDNGNPPIVHKGVIGSSNMKNRLKPPSEKDYAPENSGTRTDTSNNKKK